MAEQPTTCMYSRQMPIDVMYDGESFFRHARSGIGRYFAELIAEFSADPSLGIRPVTPYKWVASRHLAEQDARFAEVPLPRRVRYPALRALNARRLQRTEPADIVHHTFYQPERSSSGPAGGTSRPCTTSSSIGSPTCWHPDDDHLARHTEVIQPSRRRHLHLRDHAHRSPSLPSRLRQARLHRAAWRRALLLRSGTHEAPRRCPTPTCFTWESPGAQEHQPSSEGYAELAARHR